MLVFMPVSVFGVALVFVFVFIFVAIVPATGAMAEAVEQAMRQRAERLRHAREVFGAVDEFFAAIQLAVERRQRMGMLAGPILAPGVQHPFPSIGQTLQLQRADRAVALDIRGLQHEAHRVDDFATERGRRQRVFRRPFDNARHRVAIRLQRLQAPRQHVIKPLARGLGVMLGG